MHNHPADMAFDDASHLAGEAIFVPILVEANGWQGTTLLPCNLTDTLDRTMNRKGDNQTGTHYTPGVWQGTRSSADRDMYWSAWMLMEKFTEA